jgi:4-hydroxy-3-methylbut-2-enyl diphosphate reductase
MKVEIDSGSGFCFGVVNAIRKAEEALDGGEKLYCLGDIVHNDVELSRLAEKGLVTLTYEEYSQLKNATVLIRAHGEPPQTYETARNNNITLIDATCPVVLRLQQKILWKSKDKDSGRQQIIIFGKEGHAEVNGLVGQTGDSAIVINTPADIGRIDFSQPVAIFSQTTQDPEKYQQIVDIIKERMQNPHQLEVNETICRQVSNRAKELKVFARKHDVIVFVSGPNSSNGRALFEICLNENPNTFFVSTSGDIKDDFFANAESAGICGATSTPRWLMEHIAEYIKNLSI